MKLSLPILWKRSQAEVLLSTKRPKCFRRLHLESATWARVFNESLNFLTACILKGNTWIQKLGDARRKEKKMETCKTFLCFQNVPVTHVPCLPTRLRCRRTDGWRRCPLPGELIRLPRCKQVLFTSLITLRGLTRMSGCHVLYSNILLVLTESLFSLSDVKLYPVIVGNCSVISFILY